MKLGNHSVRRFFGVSRFIIALVMTGCFFIMASGCSDDDSPPPKKAAEEIPAESLSTKKDNTAPVLKPIGYRVAAVGVPLEIQLKALDTPDDVLLYTAATLNSDGTISDLPAGATIDPDSGLFSWTPVASQVGQHTVLFTVSDDGNTIMSDEEFVSITVYNSAATSETLSIDYISISNNNRPANVTYHLRIQNPAGQPVPGLRMWDQESDENGDMIPVLKNFRVYEDGYEPPMGEGSLSIFADKYDFHTLLLLDVSGNIEDDIDVIVEAAKAFCDKLTAMDRKVAIYTFTSSVVRMSGEFTTDIDALYEALDKIKKEYEPGAPTNLYGSIITGLRDLDKIVNTSDIRGYREAGLVVFTDGYHTTGGGPEAAQAAVVASQHRVYTIGLNTATLDEENLKKLGKNGFVKTSPDLSLKDAFVTTAKGIANHIRYENGRYYLLAYCSPLRDGASHRLRVEVKDNIGRSGIGVSEAYTTKGFVDSCMADMEDIQLEHFDFDRDGYYMIEGRLYDCNDADPYNWDQCKTCTDADGDGYGGSGCDINDDCNDDADDKYAPYINPNRTDMETDGFDQDCDGYDGPRG